MNPRILIVDDEAAIRSSLLESLTAEGYDAEIAESGEEALARCHGTVFDLVVTDLRLPGVSGLEILQALRNQGNVTPVSGNSLRTPLIISRLWIPSNKLKPTANKI